MSSSSGGAPEEALFLCNIDVQCHLLGSISDVSLHVNVGDELSSGPNTSC